MIKTRWTCHHCGAALSGLAQPTCLCDYPVIEPNYDEQRVSPNGRYTPYKPNSDWARAANAAMAREAATLGRHV
jgi:hypothetical protein